MKTSFKLPVWMAAAILLMSTAVMAQSNPAIPNAVRESFGKLFSSATNVRWSVKKSVYIATFIEDQTFSVAYLEKSGHLYAQARKIDRLPISLQSGVDQWTNEPSKRFGTLSERAIYEVAYSDGGTKYYITCDGTVNSAMLVADNYGRITAKNMIPAAKTVTELPAEVMAEK